MAHFTNTLAALPELPYRVRNIVHNWIRRGVPAGVLAVLTYERLYRALKSDLSDDGTPTQ